MANHALATVLAEARDYVRQAKSASTIRAYRADWRQFEGWCVVDRSREALPASAERVALCMTELARTHRVSTLTRRLASISEAHQLAGALIGRMSIPAAAFIESGKSSSRATAGRCMACGAGKHGRP